ncbi:MAG: dihydrodipicolinate synthase family protein [Acidobacteriota bacterium]
MTSKEIVSNLKGVFLPIMTPYNRRGDIDEGAFRSNLRRYVKGGFDGVVVAGSTGEGPYLNETERLRLVELARPLIRTPQLLLVGTGVETTRQTIHLSKEAIARGADAVLVLTPSYFKNRMDSAALTAHFSTIADTLRRPLMIYSIPQFTGIHMDPATIGRLSRHGNIAGLKESSGNLDFLRKVLKKADPGFRVLVGSALIMIEALQAGAAGAILGPANYIPDVCVELYRLYCQGEAETALKIQHRFVPMVQEVNVRCGIPGVKCAADFCGYKGGKPRGPLLPLRPTEERRVRAALRKAGIHLNRRAAS